MRLRNYKKLTVAAVFTAMLLSLSAGAAAQAPEEAPIMEAFSFVPAEVTAETQPEQPEYIYYDLGSVTLAQEAKTEKPALTVSNLARRSYGGSYRGIKQGDVIAGELTYYDICPICCGKTDGVTASGLYIYNGMTLDMPIISCNWLPFGALVDIEGITYVVADRGGAPLNAIGRLDVFTPEGHEAAITLGRRHAPLTIVYIP